MPAVNAWPLTAPASPGKDFARATKDFPDQSAKGDDFDHVMQATLAPRPQKTPEKNPGRSEKNLPAGKALPADAPATSASRKKTGDKVTNQEIGDQSKVSTSPDGKISPDPNALPLAVNTSEPLPVFLSLPFFFPGSMLDPVTPPSPAGKLDTPGKNSTAKDQSVSQVTSGIVAVPGKATSDALLPTAGNLATLDLKKISGTPVNREDKDLSQPNSPQPSAQDYTPVKAIQTAASAKNTAPPETTISSAADLQPKPSIELPAAEPAVESHLATALQPATNMVKAMDSATPAAMETAAEITGTGVATIAPEMKNSLKTNKVAGIDVKVLPVGEHGDAPEKNLPSSMLLAPVRATENRGTDLNFAFANGNGNDHAADSTSAVNVLDLPPLADVRMRALDRTHDMMALHSMRLLESKSDVLSVVIKPSVGTELSLELRQHPEGVEAHATLTRGDHQFLSQHWPELQQRLELRGIRLAPLGGEASFSADGNGNFQQQQTSQEEAAQQASAFAEFAATGAAGGATARLAVVHDGWESWA